jgi:putative oxidoreductase
MKIGRLFLRTVVGGYFVGHGTQKLFGWFNGHGLEATAGFFGALGMRPAKAQALAAAVSETGGGAAIVLGAGTPLAASTLIATMLVAIHKVHGANGPWVTEQGYEYNLVLIAALAALAEAGPGNPSIDSARGSSMHGPKWALIALALGAAGAAGAEGISALFPAPEAAPADEAAAEPAPTPTDAAPAAENGTSAA